MTEAPAELAVATEALLAEARANASRVLGEAQAQAQARAQAARRDADALIERAKARGAAAGRLEAAHDEAVQRVLAQADVLAAQRESYEALRRAARAAALAVRDDPGYPDLLDRLAVAARRDLGDAAELEIDPPAAGGVRAAAGSRRVDYTLVALADACLAELGPTARRLWE